MKPNAKQALISAAGNVVRITTAPVPADIQRQLALDLQTVFSAGDVQVSTASHLPPAIQIRIDCGLELWCTTFHAAAHAYMNQLATLHVPSAAPSRVTSAEAESDIHTTAVLHRFYQAHAAIAAIHPRRLGLQAVVNDAHSPRIESNYSLRHTGGFLEQFAEFIMNARTIQDTAKALCQRQPMVIEEVHCTCKHRDGFELKWLDDAQDRYVNQFFNPDGSPASGVEIMHNG